MDASLRWHDGYEGGKRSFTHIVTPDLIRGPAA